MGIISSKEETHLRSRKDEFRSLLKNCFANFLFSLVPLEIWKDIVSFADRRSIFLLSQTCWGFKELVDEKALDFALRLRKVDRIPLALKFLLKSANHGNQSAMFHIAFAFRFSGWGLKKDAKKAVEWFKKLAELGNGAAMGFYSVFLMQGDGVEKDTDLSKMWEEKALQTKNLFAIGILYYHQYGMYADSKTAFDAFEKLANEGDEFSQVFLANSFYFGKGTAIDSKQTFDWHLKAAEQGLALSQSEIGNFYQTGYGCVLDNEKGIIWHKKAANQGNEYSMTKLNGTKK